MIHGHILDVYPDFHHNTMTIWLTGRHRPYKIHPPYHPSVSIKASHEKLTALARTLRQLPEIKHYCFTYNKTTLGSSKPTLFLTVIPKTLEAFHRLPALIDSWGNYHHYQLYNVDIRLPTRYLNDHHLFCNAQVSWDGRRFHLHDDQWAIDYPLPSYKTLHLSATRNTTARIKTHHDPLRALILDDMEIQEENEADTLLSAMKHLQTTDPDIIYTHDGDSTLLPYLYHRAKQAAIGHQFTLGRDHIHEAPAKQGKSYFSYGHIVYRPPFYTLKGRVHLDQKNSFLYGESGLRGLLDISRCANIPLQMLSRLGPGTAISQIQVNTAMSQDYLIPWKKNQPESWKTSWDLLNADRGGLILEPHIGLHEGAIELDYASLYPHIMVQHNISPETLLCSCCPTSTHRVPQLKYPICTKQKGLIPQVLEPILNRRFCFKARARHPQYNTKTYEELQQAWKWILLVCFGYTGYRNARYGRIECHESITAYSRDILLSTINLVEHHGYYVLHGIVDSLWIQPYTPRLTPEQLARHISTHTGIRIDIEATYHWIVFLPSKNTDVGALNRYYGLNTAGKLRIRGVELRQKNTPPFLKVMQKEMLTTLAQAHTTTEFYEQIPHALKIPLTFYQHLLEGTVPLQDLLFTIQISRDITDYKANTLTKAALIQLRDAGIHFEPGQTVRYLVTDEHASDPRNRVKIAEFLTETTTPDRDFYRRHLAKCAESLLTPFGYTKETFEHYLNTKKMRKQTYATLLKGT